MLLLALFLLASGEQPTVAAQNPPVGAVVCIACRAQVAEPRELYTGAEWLDLESGKILKAVTREPSDSAAKSKAAGVIPQPPRKVWAVLTDFESWPGFMPHVTDMSITRRDGAELWVRVDYRVALSSMSHTTIYELDPRRGHLSWRLDTEQEHDIAQTQGHWELVPIRNGTATLVRYTASMDAGRAVPAFVEDLLIERSLSGLLMKLRGEVLER